MKAIRIAYWVQDTQESGHWELTGLIPRHRFTDEQLAEIYNKYSQWRIIDDDEEY